MSQKILVIEDDDEFRGALVHVLMSRGFRVAAASTGAEGVHAALDHAPDLVLLDLKLADMDGLGVASELRRHPAAASIPIIAVSGAVETRNAEILAPNIQGVLEKPFPVSRLFAVIEPHLRPLAMQT